MIARVSLAILLLTAGAAGCSAPAATLELIAVARSGLAEACQAQDRQHAELMRQLAAQSAALDTAFDADVRLLWSGQIKDASGAPLEPTAEWVISARKGYAAARDLLARQMLSAQADNAIRQDNLKAADEAMEMAAQLVLAQWNLSQRLRQQLLRAQAGSAPAGRQ